jgi:hypothetical protein
VDTPLMGLAVFASLRTEHRSFTRARRGDRARGS